ncbi:MAG: alpha-E domain-containing protein [Candidatus Kapaibacterium sp.]|nr:MAG: alpha-E domain-containing protein [Candidatus Kapabacteria bacterium]
MLSRVADSMYWMCRYIERAENTARFIAVNFILSLDAPDPRGAQWMPLIMASGDNGLFDEKYEKIATRENVINFLMFDTDNPNSILSCLTFARENARSIREIISSEMWEQVNKFYLLVRDLSIEAKRDIATITNQFEVFTQMKQASHLFEGIMAATMSHNEAWHFGRLGRFLERADKSSRILDVKYFILLPDVDDVGSSLDNIQWAAVLKSTSGLEMYRKRFHRFDPKMIADFLLLDTEFPRSIRYAVTLSQRSLSSITGNPIGRFDTVPEKMVGKLASELEFTDIEDIFNQGLHEFLDDLQIKINDIGNNVMETFFALRPVEELV